MCGDENEIWFMEQMKYLNKSSYLFEFLFNSSESADTPEVIYFVNILV